MARVRAELSPRLDSALSALAAAGSPGSPSLRSSRARVHGAKALWNGMWLDVGDVQKLTDDRDSALLLSLLHASACVRTCEKMRRACLCPRRSGGISATSAMREACSAVERAAERARFAAKMARASRVSPRARGQNPL